MKGKIIKGIAGFYYVHIADKGVFECKAKGIFRKQNIKPLVGDNVELDIIDLDKKEGNIVEILARKNELIRPAVANVDQALVVFSLKNPSPNLNLLDRFLITMEKQNLDSIIFFNKKDLDKKGKKEEDFKDIYKNTGYKLVFASATSEIGLKEIEELIKDKTTVLAGPSGVGKSSLLNSLMPGANIETGKLSAKIQRGKHTTRHTEIFNLKDNTYILDTPGFSSITIELEKEELWHLYPEFRDYEKQCKFSGCSHITEPECGVINALKEEKISGSRYDTYVQIYNEINSKRKY